jgi:hypothetical protein
VPPTTASLAVLPIISVTLPNHVLYPGVVTRDVVLINNSIYIRTQGSGRGYWGGINNFLKDNVWSPIELKKYRLNLKGVGLHQKAVQCHCLKLHSFGWEMHLPSALEAQHF